jgi:hypothetical protein
VYKLTVRREYCIVHTEYSGLNSGQRRAYYRRTTDPGQKNSKPMYYFSMLTRGHASSELAAKLPRSTI